MNAEGGMIQHYRSQAMFHGSDEAFWVNYPVLQNHFVPSHDHDFAEIVLIRHGMGTHESIYGEEELSAGCCLIVLPGTWHGYRVPNRLEVVNCCFRPDLLERELSIAGNDDALRGLFDPVTGHAMRGASSSESRGLAHFQLADAELAQALIYCDTLFSYQQDPKARLERRGTFLLLLALIGRCLPEPMRQFWERAVAWPSPIRECVRILEEKIAHDWTLTELAGYVHLEPSYLGRLFKKHVGETPFEYLQRRRLERAAALLLRTELSVTEVALETGYSNFPYFSRSFKRCHGQAPLQYRRSRKE